MLCIFFRIEYSQEYFRWWFPTARYVKALWDWDWGGVREQVPKLLTASGLSVDPVKPRNLPLRCLSLQPGRGVKALPGSKRQKRVSKGVYEGTRLTPKKESKTNRWETPRVENHLFSDSRDSLLTHSGGLPGAFRVARRGSFSFWLLEPGRVLNLPGRRDCNL